MLAIGCDHAGYELKQEIIKHLEEKGIEYKDFGCYSEEAVDYPVYGKLVGHAVADGECEKGILICGTGIGISRQPTSSKASAQLSVPTVSALRLPVSTTTRTSWLWVEES